jgi:hypothetical protein
MTHKTKITLLALLIFGAINIQSAEQDLDRAFNKFTMDEGSPTQQLYRAIDGLNVETVQQILGAYPQEANKIIPHQDHDSFEHVQRLQTFPLLYICSLYRSDRSAEEIAKLNQITKALLAAEANPNQFVEYTPEEQAQHRTKRRAAESPLTRAASLVGYEHYKAGEFLQVLIDYISQNGCTIDLNAVDGEGKTALFKAVQGIFPRCIFIGDNILREQNQALKAIKRLLIAGANPQLENRIETNRGEIKHKTALELITPKGKNNKSRPTEGQRVLDKLTPNIFKLSSLRQIEEYNSNVREAYEMISQVATCEVAGERLKLLKDIETDFALENHLAYKEDFEAALIADGIKVVSFVGFVTAAHKIASKYGVYTRIATAVKTLAGRVAVAATT